MELSSVTVEAMTSLVGETFTVPHFDLELELVDVDDMSGDTGNGRPFSMLFEGPTDRILEQASWPLQIQDDVIELFLVALGPQPSGRFGYEAIFS